MRPNVHELTALGAAAAIKGGEMSAAEYIESLTARIADKEPSIQAWQFFDPALPLAEARRLDARPDLRALPLAGVAVAVKDIIDTAEMPTENGTPLDAGRRPSADAAIVKLLREAGAIVMGKAVTTELAFLNPSKTRNPHNTDHTPGGSSSGSAAAVACGMVPLALGTQTNGSVIRPASFCGVYGFKPTHELFSREGVLEEAGSFDTLGLFARSLTDVGAATSVLAKNGESGIDYARAAGTPLEKARFAFVKTPAWTFAEDATKQAFEDVAHALGASCETVELPQAFDRFAEYHRTIMLAEIALNFGRYYERGKEALSPAMREAIETGGKLLAKDYAEAYRARGELGKLFAELTDAFAAVITPPAAGPAPRGHGSTGNPIFCTLGTYLGIPALSLPRLSIDGLPLGIQLLGARYGEEKLFQAAAALLRHPRFQPA